MEASSTFIGIPTGFFIPFQSTFFGSTFGGFLSGFFNSASATAVMYAATNPVMLFAAELILSMASFVSDLKVTSNTIPRTSPGACSILTSARFLPAEVHSQNVAGQLGTSRLQFLVHHSSVTWLFLDVQFLVGFVQPVISMSAGTSMSINENVDAKDSLNASMSTLE
jgi:hypothetical protein